mmetsp:Transcript_27848/g.84992  ORF Transcript_27848/g.84992 Transcript_27848/m.84992 type:complete len:405 (-) Transcript_27848:409-1623(-)
MAMRSFDIFPSFSVEHATSSSSIDVPVSRAPPTMGIRPLRASQKTLYSFGSWRNASSLYPTCEATGTLEFRRAIKTSSMAALRAASSSPRHSMRRAAPSPSSGRRVISGQSLGSSPMRSHCVSERRSKISTASTEVFAFSADVASHASSISWKMRKALALKGRSGTVLYVTRETNPRVPSEPTISLLRISTGFSGEKSASALMEYPVVFLMRYFSRISAMSPASACTRMARSDIPFKRRAWDCLKASTDVGSPVSSTVPSTRTTRKSAMVWYVFCFTPQHMPEELLATMPPIMHESMDAGSGPILYCLSRECFFLYAARSRFTSPPMSPGSSVIFCPPLSIWYRRHALPLWESFNKMESVMACPDRDVPAARNVTGVLYRRAEARTSTTSCSLFTRTTACGLSR